jgi:hypothetical protein
MHGTMNIKYHRELHGTGHAGGKFLLRYYELYQRMQLQFYVLLMTGAMDARNMYRVILQ